MHTTLAKDKVSAGDRLDRAPRGPRARGVVMVITLLAILLLAALVLFVINLGQQVNRRIETQNAADAAAAAGATQVARSLNLVATNNIGISMNIALVNVLDSLDSATRYTEHEQRAFRDRLADQMAIGVSNVPPADLRDLVEQELNGLLNDLDEEVEQLEPMVAFFDTFDMAPLTHYEGPDGRGYLWRAMEAMDQQSRATLESLPRLAAQVAVAGGEAASEDTGGKRVVFAPVRPEMPVERGQFDEFEHPVKFGTLPDAIDHPVNNRGPYDAIFGWRERVFGPPSQLEENRRRLEQRFPSLDDGLSGLERSGHDLPRHAIAGAADRLALLAMPGRLLAEAALGYVPGGGGDTPPTPPGPRVLVGYTTFGTQQYLLDRVWGFWQRRLEHSRWRTWMRRLADSKLNYLWPGRGGTRVANPELDRLIEPDWRTDFSEALQLAEQPDRIKETAFFEVEIKSRHPPDHPDFLESGSWAPRRSGRFPRIVRINGWQDPREWESHPQFQSVTDLGWRRDWEWQVLWEPDINLDIEEDQDGNLVTQTVYYIGHYYFAGVNVGEEVEVPDPYEGFDPNSDAAPAPMQFVPDSVTRDAEDRWRHLTFLAVGRQRDTAQAWPGRFTGGKPDPYLTGLAQVKVFNNHSWDLWTHMWHAQLEPVADYNQWATRVEQQIGAGHPDVSDADLAAVADLLRHTADIAEVFHGDSP